MTARSLMITGALTGFLVAVFSIAFKLVGETSLMLFACGALFGKGYGVWEERERCR